MSLDLRLLGPTVPTSFSRPLRLSLPHTTVPSCDGCYAVNELEPPPRGTHPQPRPRRITLLPPLDGVLEPVPHKPRMILQRGRSP